MSALTRYLKGVGTRARGQARAPRTRAEAIQEIARLRTRLLANGQTMATLRATERFMAEALPFVPQGWEKVRAEAELERLRGQLRAFTILWTAWQDELALGPLPELAAAEEVELRTRLYAQLTGAAAVRGGEGR